MTEVVLAEKALKEKEKQLPDPIEEMLARRERDEDDEFVTDSELEDDHPIY